MADRVDFSELKDKLLASVVVSGTEYIDFICSDGTSYRLEHVQDCCEDVYIEDVSGDISDLIGTPILLAEEASGPQPEHGVNPLGVQPQDCETWTFYKLRTIKGSVDVRWYGTSNGCYSEKAHLWRTKAGEQA